MRLNLFQGGIALALMCLGMLNSVQAQPGIPGRPNIPQPNFPQPNFPRPNIPQPNIPPLNIPQPNIPQPNFPRPNIPGMGGPQMPNIPGPNFGGFETVYTCAKCNVEIGRGIVAPAIATCPRCGLVYRNGVAWDDGRAAPPAMPVNMPNFGLPGGNAVNNPPLPPIDLNSANSANPSVPVTVVPPPSSNRVLFIIGGVILALLVILGMVLAILHTRSKGKAARKVRRRRPARKDDDFDD